jgi:CRISPR-associated protein Csb3
MNPGQFFACCGLFELADRLWEGVEGRFDAGEFVLNGGCDLAYLLQETVNAPLSQLDPEDDGASPIEIGAPFRIRLDWWKDDGGGRLKPWAGSMRGVRIARAMRATLLNSDLQGQDLLDRGMVVYDPADPDKKVEPFYFDARRGSSAQPIDIGFSPDSLQLTSAAYPAVEFLCLVGLQRFRPLPAGRPRVFDYFTWRRPLAVAVASVAACGLLQEGGSEGFRFENAFRTDQRKHKAFTTASRI